MPDCIVEEVVRGRERGMWGEKGELAIPRRSF